MRGRELTTWKLAAAAVAVVLVLVAGLAVAGVFDGGPADREPEPAGEAAGDEAATGDEAPGDREHDTITHIHGLGVDPDGGDLLVATHEGLFRAAKRGGGTERIGDSHDDFMGFNVVGPGEYVASGHGGAGSGGPANLGLIRSQDGGLSWDAVALSGEADFHILRARDERVYDIHGSVQVSDDGGRNWRQSPLEASLIDIAIDPRDSRRAIAIATEAVFETRNAGRSWRRAAGPHVALVSWTNSGIYAVEQSGRVSFSRNRGRSWRAVGSVTGEPVAIASRGDSLYVALADNTVQESRDRGRSWRQRVGG